MIKEAYCSYEVAKLLKEKGFDVKCHSHYWAQDKPNPRYCDLEQDWNCASEDWYSRPTHQMAMAWLREKNIIIDIHLDVDGEEATSWVFSIYEKVNPQGGESYARLLFDDDELFDIDDVDGVTEAALKYSLENLI